ncbi:MULTISPECIES: PilW family protein [Pontibacillus]|uniref:Prepilin-type N-terminal cleavage/methylation domain-containing protein n=1 Tax=Pontibacillus chungwhensis TaxID=265426 RepID=A0ABY8UXR3_9BACI|nr:MULTISPECIES: prepilin-type N-terminal cleavage/methylation domain-containing protein [Pontibacillus]MCD5325680.1 prepilin-type N-terminal cleavage/methylation domain-containing protein [Pontibacillus sp. HN14]WIF98078.1 prepilin-type N-terminal cleavage/methylation domain-containing protein [Pontibacillus chungwhensis]
MKRFLRNEEGVTLVELLAALALLGIVILLISNAHLFGQKQFVSQSEQIENESNVRYAMNVITKEVRRAETVTVSSDVLKTNAHEFELRGNRIFKDQSVLVENIEMFSVQKNNEKITITIKSMPNEFEKASTLTTDLYIRE